MSKLTDSVAFIKGLAEGLNVKEDTPERKLILKLVEALDLLAGEVEELKEEVEELDEYVENMDEDLSSLEDAVFEDEDDEEYEDDDECGCGCDHHHGHHHKHRHDDEIEGESIVEYECPHCGEKEEFELSEFDLDEDYECPKCHKPLFPEVDEE